MGDFQDPYGEVVVMVQFRYSRELSYLILSSIAASFEAWIEKWRDLPRKLDGFEQSVILETGHLRIVLLDRL